MIPPYRTGVMHSPPIPPTTPNRPIPNTPPTPPPPGFDYSSAVDATGGHITELLHNIFQHHYIHLLPPIIDQIHVPPNQNTASLATVCCEHIFHLTAPLSPTVDITHRHLLTLTVALLLYSPNIREHITSLLFTPLIHHLSCVITQQHMANIRSSFHAHITWFDLVDLNQCTYSPPPFPQPLLTSSPPATPTHRRLTKLLHYLTLTLTVSVRSSPDPSDARRAKARTGKHKTSARGVCCNGHCQARLPYNAPICSQSGHPMHASCAQPEVSPPICTQCYAIPLDLTDI